MSGPDPGPVLTVPLDGGLAAALGALSAGAVVAVPTDTVYGLAARLDRPDAVARVVALKGRPPGLALPVACDSVAQASAVAPPLAGYAAVLARRFWPGPLTLVVRAGPLVGGTGDTVGLRVPDHPGVRALCRGAGPLTLTSANPHGEPPGTSAARVAVAFAGTGLALVLDGGESPGGVASTVVDCTGPAPRCLRAGGLDFDLVLAAC